VLRCLWNLPLWIYLLRYPLIIGAALLLLPLIAFRLAPALRLLPE